MVRLELKYSDLIPKGESVMPKAIAVFETENASRYLQAMFKHFAHKVEVQYNEFEGSATMPNGELSITADGDRMRFEVRSENVQNLLRTRYIVDAHIVRFAFREKLLGLAWQSFE